MLSRRIGWLSHWQVRNSPLKESLTQFRSLNKTEGPEETSTTAEKEGRKTDKRDDLKQKRKNFLSLEKSYFEHPLTTLQCINHLLSN